MKSYLAGVVFTLIAMALKAYGTDPFREVSTLYQLDWRFTLEMVGILVFFLGGACVVFAVVMSDFVNWVDLKSRGEVRWFGLHEVKYLGLVAITAAMFWMGNYAFQSYRDFNVAERLSVTEHLKPGSYWLSAAQRSGYNHGEIAFYGYKVGRQEVLAVAIVKPTQVVFVDVHGNGSLTAVYPAKVTPGYFPGILPGSKPRRPTREEANLYASLYNAK